MTCDGRQPQDTTQAIFGEPAPEESAAPVRQRGPAFGLIACRRIEEAQRQGDLLRDIAPKTKPVQEVML